MKNAPMILALAIVAVSAGCSRPADAPASADAPAGAATDAARAPADDARSARAPRDSDARAPDAPPSAGDAAPAAARQGIAVGEPHPSAPPPVGDARYDGFGALRFGMTADEARKAWPGGLQGDDVKADNCAYLRSAGTAAGPFLMFEQGRFVRYDMRGANAVAPGGGRVGMSADDVRRAYGGRVAESPHHYVQGGKYLRIADPASSSRALLFEVDAAGRVTEWRVGQAPQVDYVEGCS